jgi:excisionase family DNA binding protein
VRLMSLRDAGEMLGISPDTLRAQIHRGRLHAEKFGRDWLVRDAELERYRRESLGRRRRRRSAAGSGVSPISRAALEIARASSRSLCTRP